MESTFLIKGIILGFSIAAPVGPIGVLCIRKTLQYGRLSGFFSGLGAAVADTGYGVVAVFGLSLVSGLLLAGQQWFQFLGGLFLLYLGLRTFKSKPADPSSQLSHQTLIGDFVSTFFLTAMNPMTILSYLAIFAGLGLTDIDKSSANAGLLVFGVFVGSALWWLILSEGVTLFRNKIGTKGMAWINSIAGAVIMAFGLLALLSSWIF